jgi:hypothetical protein
VKRDMIYFYFFFPGRLGGSEEAEGLLYKWKELKHVEDFLGRMVEG